jgi:hypothetical protein
MTRNRENATRQAMLDEIAEIDQNALALADGFDRKIHAIVMRSIENTRLGVRAFARNVTCAATSPGHGPVFLAAPIPFGAFHGISASPWSLVGTWPETNTKSPARVAGESGRARRSEATGEAPNISTGMTISSSLWMVEFSLLNI